MFKRSNRSAKRILHGIMLTGMILSLFMGMGASRPVQAEGEVIPYDVGLPALPVMSAPPGDPEGLPADYEEPSPPMRISPEMLVERAAMQAEALPEPPLAVIEGVDVASTGNEFLYILPAVDTVCAYSWELAIPITISIDDPGTGTNPDLLQVEDSGGGYECFNYGSSIDIQAGYVVTVTDGTVIKTHTVTTLEITSVDPDLDDVTGIAAPGSSIEIYADNNTNYWWEYPTAGSGGDWTADFSGDLDLKGGSYGWAYDWTGDTDDATLASFSIPNPRFKISATGDYLMAWEWGEGTELTVSVDDPATPANPDATTTGVVDFWDSLYLDFSGLIDIQPGFLISVTDGITTKTHMVTEVDITDVDPVNDEAWGTAAAGSMVSVDACSPPVCEYVEAQTNTGGNWWLDFSGLVDLGQGDWVAASQYDTDGDGTEDYFGIQPKRFGVYPVADEVHIDDWEPDTEVTIEVDDPGTTADPDASQTVTTNEDGQIQISFSGEVDIQPGFIVTAYDTIDTKVHTVTTVEITAADPLTDIVTGTAEADSWVEVEVCDTSSWSCAYIGIYSDNSGAWAGDFSGTFDIVGGTRVNASQWDNDNDFTRYVYNLPWGDGIISGVVNGPDTNPVTGVPVLIQVFRNSDNFLLVSTNTNPVNGTFSAIELPMDEEVYVCASFDDPDLDGYPGECYDNTRSFPVPIVLTVGDPEYSGVIIALDWTHDSATEEHLTFNTRSGRILEDVAVRQAIAYGTDRQTILEDAFQPFGQTGEILNALVYPSSWFEAPASDPLLTVYDYDPVTARALLMAAGWVDGDLDGIREKGGVPLALDYKTTTAAVRMASGALFKSQMAAIGIQIIDTYIPSGDFFGYTDPALSPLLTGDFDIAEFAWIVEDYDEVYGVYYTGNSQNYGGYSNTDLDGYYDRAKGAKETLNDASFLTNALGWQYEYSEDLPSFPLFTRLPMPWISGTVRTGAGAPFTGVSVELSLRDGLGTLLSTWTTNPDDGTFSIPVLPGFSGSIMPSLAEYVFNPVSRPYTNVTGDMSGEDFTAIPYNLLTVIKAGTGSGTVTSLPSGISCGSDCTESYAPGTVVKLTATATPGSLFTGWSGAGCSGMKFCYTTMSIARTVTATFTTIPPGTFPLTVVKGGTGSGTVTNLLSPYGISCGTDCWEFYTAGTTVKLAAAASAGSTFIGWSGACGSMDYCWMLMGASKYVTANFVLTPAGTYPLIVAMKGKGTGTVTSNVPGISCWPDCYEFYTSGTMVRLAAVAAPGSTFTGWSGACGGVAYCWVTMSQARFVTANWVLNTASLPSLEADLALFRDPFAFFTFLTRPLEALLP